MAIPSSVVGDSVGCATAVVSSAAVGDAAALSSAGVELSCGAAAADVEAPPVEGMVRGTPTPAQSCWAALRTAGKGKKC